MSSYVYLSDLYPKCKAGRNNRNLDRNRDKKILYNLGLPGNLIELIHSGQLETAIKEAYIYHDKVNAMLEEWEQKNWDIYMQCPWFKAREEWKANGRPKCEWYEILSSFHNRRGGTVPLMTRVIDKTITYRTTYDYFKRQAAKKRAEKEQLKQKGDS